MALGMDVGLSTGDFGLDGDPAPYAKRGGAPSPIFDQTAGSIKMPLGTDVGLSPGNFVLDGDPVPLPKKGTEPPNFWPMFIVAKQLDGSRWQLARR